MRQVDGHAFLPGHASPCLPRCRLPTALYPRMLVDVVSPLSGSTDLSGQVTPLSTSPVLSCDTKPRTASIYAATRYDRRPASPECAQVSVEIPVPQRATFGSSVTPLASGGVVCCHP